MDRKIVLSVQGVSKKFCRNLKRSLFYGAKDIALDMMGLDRAQGTLRKQEFWALSDVSFQLHQGEALGLIGVNGSGKSTLLRIIAGLIKPDIGIVDVEGRVAPLIALGAGFSPILTGRENVYANMAILGLSRKEIDERFSEVIEFAEIGDAIDAPVQNYSSGMAARLGFASAIFTEPDILLIDEVLAVGDVEFQAKCSTKLAEMRQKGTTFILVSHNSMVINAVCDSAIYLLEGKLQANGPTNLVVKQYEKELFSAQNESVGTGPFFLPKKTRLETLGADITHVCFKDKKGKLLKSPQTGNFVYLCVGCKVWEKADSFSLGVAVHNFSLSSQPILILESHYDGQAFSLEEGEHEIQISLSQLGLTPGNYDMELYLKRENPHANLDIIQSIRFTVEESEDASTFLGKSLFYQPRLWKVSRRNYDDSV